MRETINVSFGLAVYATWVYLVALAIVGSI